MIADAFPRRPAPHREPPELDELQRAREDFALHIPSLFAPDCLGCEEEWPCTSRRRSSVLLDRAGLLDIDGDLRT